MDQVTPRAEFAPPARKERRWRPQHRNAQALDRFILDTYGPEVAAEYGIRRRR